MNEPFAKIASFLVASLATALLIAAFNFFIDPVQLFGPSRFHRPVYTSDSRLQNAGLIRSQDFDAVLMGTSLSVHFRQSDIDLKFGVRSIKLAMSGSTSVEQHFVFDAVLQRHPKLVIWELDDRAFFNSPEIDYDEYLPADLYRANIKGIARYLFSLDTGREFLWIALGAIQPFATIAHGLAAAQYLKFYGDQVDEIGALPPNADLSKLYSASKIRSAFVASLKYPKKIYARYNYEDMVRNFERDFVSLINDHPDIKFYVFLPPYSILQFVTIREVAPDALRTIYEFSAYAFPRLLSLPNVILFDFRDVQDITHNLDNYADLLHFSPSVDQKVLSFLAAGEHAVDRTVPLASIDRLRAQVAAYDLVNMTQGACASEGVAPGEPRCGAAGGGNISKN